MFKQCWKTTTFSRAGAQRAIFSKSRVVTDARWPGWEVVIGLEVHAQIKSRAKLFSRAWTSTYDEVPNSHVDPFDAAFPGMLPKLNEKCVELAVRTAIALKSEIQPRSSFDRKHYFYPDLPPGYQITQHYAPLATRGQLYLPKSQVSVNIKQIQLEQDTAKSTFDEGDGASKIDLNRAGTALMEIVSEPDMKSAEEASEYVRTLQAILRSVGSSDGNMEQGSLRCDVNVSVNRIGEPRGTRCEIKNLNSVRFMIVAITSEALRHISRIERGLDVKQETRGFSERTAETYSLRSKEDAPDYRYMPDPNLPPLLLTGEYISTIRETMPELPEQTRARLLARGLNERDVDFLMSIDSGKDVGFDGKLGEGIVAFFDRVSESCNSKIALNWITHDLYGALVAEKQTFKDNTVSVEQLVELIQLVEGKHVTGTSGKLLLKHMVETRSQRSPKALSEALSLTALQSDTDVVEKLCKEAIIALPEEAGAVRAGNYRVINKLVGYVMKSSKGRANAQAIQLCLKELLSNRG